MKQKVLFAGFLLLVAIVAWSQTKVAVQIPSTDTPGSGQIPKWDGTQWLAEDDTGGGGSATNAVSTISSNGVAISTAATNLHFWAGQNVSYLFTNANGNVDVQITAATNVVNDGTDVKLTDVNGAARFVAKTTGSEMLGVGADDWDFKTLADSAHMRSPDDTASIVVSNGGTINFSGTIPTMTVSTFNASTLTVGDLKLDDAGQDHTYSVVMAADASANRTWGIALPNSSVTNTVRGGGTFILSGDTFTGDVAATLDTDGSTALTIVNGVLTNDTRNLSLTGIIQLAQTPDYTTNNWAINTSFGLGTNAFYTSGAATIGLTGVANVPTTGLSRYGELSLLATGDIVFTNAPSIKASDFLTSRTITNGNACEIAIKVVAGRSTNMAIVQFR